MNNWFRVSNHEHKKLPEITRFALDLKDVQIWQVRIIKFDENLPMFDVIYETEIAP